jgi:hypothetical protein
MDPAARAIALASDVTFDGLLEALADPKSSITASRPLTVTWWPGRWSSP